MAEIWYVGITETEFNEKEQKIHEISFRACIELLDLRSRYLTCKLDGFPKLQTGDPLVDGSNFIYVLIKVTQKEIDSEQEGSFKEGFYKLPKTVIETGNILRKANEKERKRRED